MQHLRFLNVWAFVLACLAARASFAADDKKTEASKGAPAAQPAAPETAKADEGAEDVDVDNIKKKYWATGNESEMGVVQNRLYSKAGKFQLGVAGGVALSDPFLSIKSYGGSVGYHFSEFLGASFIYNKFNVNPSSALNVLRAGEKQANTVEPYNYWGGQVNWSLLYGKLSLLGQSIIYYDMFFTAGGGRVKIETGEQMSPNLGRQWALSGGLGQRFYLNSWLSLKVDYNAIRYTEHLIEKEISTKIGTDAGTRTNYTHMILVGVDALFGVL